MPSLPLLIIVALAVFIILGVLKSKQGDAGSIGFPYRPARTLFSNAERSFLGVLDQAVGSEHRVFGKVRLADLANLKQGLGNRARQGALNRIAYKHIDFIVCRSNDLSVVCVVELNDKTHSSGRAQYRDEFVLKVCQTINLPLLMIPAKHAYSPQDVRAQFLAAISPPQADLPVGT